MFFVVRGLLIDKLGSRRRGSSQIEGNISSYVFWPIADEGAEFHVRASLAQEPVAPHTRNVVARYGTLALDEGAIIRVLDEAGFLPTGGIAKVDLLNIPSGLNARETEGYLRNNGAKICGSRT